MSYMGQGRGGGFVNTCYLISKYWYCQWQKARQFKISPEKGKRICIDWTNANKQSLGKSCILARSPEWAFKLAVPYSLCSPASTIFQFFGGLEFFFTYTQTGLAAALLLGGEARWRTITRVNLSFIYQRRSKINNNLRIDVAQQRQPCAIWMI